MAFFRVFMCFSNNYTIFEIITFVKDSFYDGIMLRSLTFMMDEYLPLKTAPAEGKTKSFEFNTCG